MAGLINEKGKPAAPSGEVARVVIAAKKILSQPEIAQHVVDLMKNGGDPATSIAEATIFLMTQLYQKSNGTMPPKVMVPAAQRVMVDIARLGQAAGLFKITPELIKAAVKIAIDKLHEKTKAQQGPAPAAPQPMLGA